MKILVGAMAALVVALGGGAPPQADGQQQATLQAWCVTTNHAINRSISADYRGAKVYFCSEACREKFLAEPGRYAVRANYQLMVTGQARQTLCPFTGKPLNPKIAPMEVGGLSIGFCCRQCQQTVSVADYQTRIELVFSDAAFSKGFAVNGKQQ